MSEPEIEPGYPLRWPEGRARSGEYRPALFRNEGRPMSITAARQRLGKQISAMTKPGQGWRVRDMILSTNIRYTAAGARDQNISRKDPADPGVAFYFARDRQPHVLACDRWDSVADNIAAIAAHIEALRGQERWGVADLHQAFAGHVALPAAPHWSTVLDVGADASGDAIRASYRRLSLTLHPDKGGDRAGWDRLQAAYDQAKKEGRA